MKKIAVLAVFLLLGLSPALLASTYTITFGSTWGPYNYYKGGEFTGTPNADLLAAISSAQYVINGAIGTADVNSPANFDFQTFCVEKKEDIAVGHTYDVTLSQGTIYSNQPLTLGAAWLYYEFATGALLNYDYSNTTVLGRAGFQAAYPTNKDNSADLLQQALWYFMGVANNPTLDGGYATYSTDASDYYIALADSHFAALGQNAMDPNNGTFGVDVMNLWVQGTTIPDSKGAQDTLVLAPVPVPDGGLTVMLLGIGVGILAVIARRLGR